LEILNSDQSVLLIIPIAFFQFSFSWTAENPGWGEERALGFFPRVQEFGAWGAPAFSSWLGLRSVLEKRGGGALHADKRKGSAYAPVTSVPNHRKHVCPQAITLFLADHGFAPGMTGILIWGYVCYQYWEHRRFKHVL